MKTIRELVAALAAGQTTSVQLTENYLQRIAQQNPTLNAYLHVANDRALAQAAAADARRARGEAVTPLTGIPLAIKDILHCVGQPTTCASKILEGFQPPFPSTAVQQLCDAGAVLLGKTNMDEFAMGASSEHSAFGPVNNPWQLAYIPGGSSGGSAAAVAADLCVGALGTDTGGSIRQPAAMCGIVGLKPTYGRVSRYGVVAFASSLDQVGPMTKTVEDAALLLNAIAGHDPQDSTSANRSVPDFTQALTGDIRGLRIGVVEEYLSGGVDPEVAAAVQAALTALEHAGATIQPVQLPYAKYAVPCYYVIAPAEASANLARYDGIRFGHRTARPADLRALYRHSRSEGFGPEVIRRIMIGTFVLSSGYYDAYYGKAQRVRTLITRDYEAAFQAVDVICTPTTPYTAFPQGTRIEDPIQMYLADVCTAGANLAGLPGISIPCGFSGKELPIGLQFVGKPWDEATILRVAHTYERATSWHQRHPPMARTE